MLTTKQDFKKTNYELLLNNPFNVKHHLYELAVVFQLILKCLDTLVEVFGVSLVVQLCLQAFCLLLFQFSLQHSEALGQRVVVLLCLPLQVQPVLGQTLCLCEQSFKQRGRLMLRFQM